MRAASQYTFPLATYREHYTKLGVLDCKQNAWGEWRHALKLGGVKKVVKAFIESGNPRALSMLNEPVYRCIALSLDNIFPEYLPGADGWMRVMSLLPEEERRGTLHDLQRDWEQNGYSIAEHEAKQKAQNAAA